ncbi:MAG: GntR family transcriptional regulator [Pirellulales bacterium]
METGLVRGLRDQIVDRLRSEVLSGRLSEGTPLREIELSSRFGVSRGPIREALQQLTYEGILVGQPNRGVRVAPAAPDVVRELVVPIRRAIETFALRQFIGELDSDDFVHWESILSRLRSACERANFAEIAEQDIAFHRSILSRSRQEDLLAIWSVLVARIWTHFRENNPKYSDPMEIYQEHRALLSVFREGDPEAAVAALQSHIESDAPYRPPSRTKPKS